MDKKATQTARKNERKQEREIERARTITRGIYPQ